MVTALSVPSVNINGLVAVDDCGCARVSRGHRMPWGLQAISVTSNDALLLKVAAYMQTVFHKSSAREENSISLAE